MDNTIAIDVTEQRLGGMERGRSLQQVAFAHRVDQTRLIQWAQSHSLVLDLGVGEGGLLEEFQKNGVNCLGIEKYPIDYKPGMVVADFANLPIARGSVPAMISTFALGRYGGCWGEVKSHFTEVTRVSCKGCQFWLALVTYFDHTATLRKWSTPSEIVSYGQESRVHSFDSMQDYWSDSYALDDVIDDRWCVGSKEILCIANKNFYITAYKLERM